MPATPGGPLAAPALARRLTLAREACALTCLVTSHLRLPGHCASLLLLRITGRTSHFALRSLPAKAPLSALLSGGDAAVADPQELVGRAFLVGAQEDGQRLRARVAERASEREPSARRSGDRDKLRAPPVRASARRVTKRNELKESSGSADRPLAAAPEPRGPASEALLSRVTAKTLLACFRA